MISWLDVNHDTPSKPRFTDRWSIVHALSGFVSAYIMMKVHDKLLDNGKFENDHSWAIIGGLVLIHQGWEYYEEVYEGIPKWVGSKANTIGDTLYFTIGALLGILVYNRVHEVWYEYS
jgi:hypothetical protein